MRSDLVSSQADDIDILDPTDHCALDYTQTFDATQLKGLKKPIVEVHDTEPQAIQEEF